MRLSDRELLQRLGQGEPITEVCEAAGLERSEFDAWWRKTSAARLATTSGTRQANVQADVEIARDRNGIPHILASSDGDLFFGLGYAMAQDRLFQLDYLRRKGMGCLAAVLGREALHHDRVARIVGLNRIATAEWERLDGRTREVLQAFSHGINAFIEESADRLPIEFELLGYQPTPWTPIDCLAIENEFRWYLTGRFPIIVIPELIKRTLGEGPLYQDCILGEADDEPILWPGEYDSRSSADRSEPVGAAMADPHEGIGSNNWVVNAGRSRSGSPLLASDPHIAFEAVSCWYECHLSGGSYNVAGMTYIGMPGVLIGRNERVAWGITNNICSQRDLYQERTHPAHPDSFEFGGQWEKAQELLEVIDIRGEEPVTETVLISRNGPVVDTILPPAARGTGPVTLKWLGAHHGGWLTALLDMAQAENVTECMQATKPWHVPTFSVVAGDVDGNIGYQSTGRIPLREKYERAYRPGWDPEHQWVGLLPFEEMPSVINPDRGWVATANNRVAADDYPYKLFGCWASGWRALRIRQMIETQPQLSLDEMQVMQRDALSLRAAKCVPLLLEVLDAASTAGNETVAPAIEALRSWNHEVTTDSAGAAIFNVFFSQWCRVVAAERFSDATRDLVAPALAGCASRLLENDEHSWFQSADRGQKILEAFESSVAEIVERCGADPANWSWAQLHRLPLRHVLSDRGDLGELLDHGGQGVVGDVTTVANTGCEADYRAGAGAGYRMTVDLASSPPALMAIDCQSQSGQVGSSHYDDQLADWVEGQYHVISLDLTTARASALTVRTLTP